MADSMPNEKRRHLPSCLTKEKIYKMYKEEVMKINRGGKLLGYTQFRKMWSSDFEDVVIPKVH